MSTGQEQQALRGRGDAHRRYPSTTSVFFFLPASKLNEAQVT